MSLEESLADTEVFFATHDYFEIEVSRRTEEFGNTEHVWNIDEAHRSSDDAEPECRSVNSNQLFRNEHRRWQITSMIWDRERRGHLAL